MKILAIETSCDETAIAILEYKNSKFRILSSVVSSQIKIHAKWGGVVPMLAKREHLKNLPLVLKKALKKAEIKNPKKELNLVAVVNGPGLEPALWTGVNFAKELSEKWNIPLLPINHMEGHLFSVFLPENRKIQNFKFQIPNIEFPAVALLVSGGHTELVLVKDWLKYKRLGQTRDDAAGEAFDKVAKMLNLGYPGGPIISKLASNYRGPTSIVLPRPMINTKDYDFSFSGLKTAVLYKIKEFKKLTPKIKVEICHEFQQAVIDVLISKTFKATKEYKAKTIILGGGVAANDELRKQFVHKLKTGSYTLNFLASTKKFTGDNAAMIALTAYFRWESSFAKASARQRKKPGLKHTNRAFKNLKADGNLKLS